MKLPVCHPNTCLVWYTITFKNKSHKNISTSINYRAIINLCPLAGSASDKGWRGRGRDTLESDERKAERERNICGGKGVLRKV